MGATDSCTFQFDGSFLGFGFNDTNCQKNNFELSKILTI
jgi:hypothetical protein